MIPKSPQTYGGMLTQDGFAQLYAYIHARITFGYTEEEVSFLMGRAPYYFADYERMENGARLSLQDIETLSCIFSDHIFAEITFEKDEVYGYHEKRLVRVKKIINDGMLFYTLVHPWDIKKEKRKRNEPIKLYEIIRNLSVKEELKIKAEIVYVLKRLLNRGFFSVPQSAHAIYVEIEKLVSRNITIYPVYLKEVLYEFLHAGKLILKTTNGVMHYYRSLPGLRTTSNQ